MVAGYNLSTAPAGANPRFGSGHRIGSSGAADQPSERESVPIPYDDKTLAGEVADEGLPQSFIETIPHRLVDNEQRGAAGNEETPRQAPAGR